MVHSTHGHHHLHKRKRSAKDTKLVRFIDKLVYAAGLFGWIMTIPQVFKIWVEQNAGGVSVLSWLAYAIVGVVWILYGIVHKDRHIIIIYSGFVLLNSFVVIGTLLYG